MPLTITIADLQSMDDPKDGWYHIEANGDHPNTLKDGSSILQILDDEAMLAIASAGCPDEGILLDVEHKSTEEEDPDTEAAGWVRELATFDDGAGNLQLAGRIEWTGLGLPLVRGRRYKHFSTVYSNTDPDLCAHLGGNRYRPLVLLGLALTNRPNNYGQRPITNNRCRIQNTNTKPTTRNMTEFEEIKAKLGLDPSATLADTLAAIDDLAGSAEDAATAEAETLLNSEGLGDLPDEEKEEIKQGLVTNRGLALLTIKAYKERKQQETGSARYAKTPPRTDNGTRKAAGAEEGRLIVNRAREIQTRERQAGRTCSFWKAQKAAKRELGYK